MRDAKSPSPTCQPYWVLARAAHCDQISDAAMLQARRRRRRSPRDPVKLSPFGCGDLRELIAVTSHIFG